MILGWALADLPAVTKYVRTMPAGPDREWVVKRIAQAHLHRGAGAFEVRFRSVENPADRKTALDYVSRHGESDPELELVFKKLRSKIEEGDPASAGSRDDD